MRSLVIVDPGFASAGFDSQVQAVAVRKVIFLGDGLAFLILESVSGLTILAIVTPRRRFSVLLLWMLLNYLNLGEYFRVLLNKEST